MKGLGFVDVVFDHDVNEADAVLKSEEFVCEAVGLTFGKFDENGFDQPLVLLGAIWPSPVADNCWRDVCVGDAGRDW